MSAIVFEIDSDNEKNEPSSGVVPKTFAEWAEALDYDELWEECASVVPLPKYARDEMRAYVGKALRYAEVWRADAEPVAVGDPAAGEIISMQSDVIAPSLGNIWRVGQVGIEAMMELREEVLEALEKYLPGFEGISEEDALGPLAPHVLWVHAAGAYHQMREFIECYAYHVEEVADHYREAICAMAETPHRVFELQAAIREQADECRHLARLRGDVEGLIAQFEAFLTGRNDSVAALSLTVGGWGRAVAGNCDDARPALEYYDDLVAETHAHAEVSPAQARQAIVASIGGRVSTSDAVRRRAWGEWAVRQMGGTPAGSPFDLAAGEPDRGEFGDHSGARGLANLNTVLCLLGDVAIDHHRQYRAENLPPAN